MIKQVLSRKAAVGFILSLCLVLVMIMPVAAQEEEFAPVNPSMEANNLYLVENQWGGEDAEWNPGGLWVLGGREGQPVVAVNFESADEGLTLEGEITYADEGPIAFRAEQLFTNSYLVQVQWGGEDADWNNDGLWVIGTRDEQPVVAADLTQAEEGGLTGEIVYAGEGPIGFRGEPIDGGVFFTENQWGDEDSEWHIAGAWVIGGRADQQVESVAAASTDEGMTLEGEMVYEGEGPIGFRATHVEGNVYMVENQWGGDDAEWNPGGYWLIGSRGEQKIVALDLFLEDNLLEGMITYAGEGPIRISGYPLQALNNLFQESAE